MIHRIINSQSSSIIKKINIDMTPEPGNWFILDNDSFFIYSKTNRYKLVDGIYKLSEIDLLVKYQKQPEDSTYIMNHWVIGNHECTYNALSPLLRCAVNPIGPCSECAEFRSINN